MENCLSDGFLPCLLCRTMVLNLFQLDEPYRPTVADGSNTHCFCSLDQSLTENGQNMSHSEKVDMKQNTTK